MTDRTSRVIGVALVVLLAAACGQEETGWTPEQEYGHLSELYGADGTGLTQGKSVGKADAALAVPRGVLALTFDDGPHPTRTAAVMDILEAEGITGVFFMLGEKVGMYPEVVAAVADRGHHAANHSWVHKLMTEQDSETLAMWIGDTKEAIGDDAKGHLYFRPPYGGISSRVRGLIEGAGYKVVMWNIDTLDWDYADGRTSFTWVPAIFRDDYMGWVQYHARAVGGGVALFHDVHQFTLDWLPAVIRCWKDPQFYWDSLDEETRVAYRAYYASTGVDPDLAFTFADLNSYRWPSFVYEDGEQLEPTEWLEENLGWVGGACAADEDCLFEGGVCLLPAPQEGDEELSVPGVCSVGCTKYCTDDLDNVMHYQTFCVEVVEGAGHCMPKCSTAIPCQPGYECLEEMRFGDISASSHVCMPTLPLTPSPLPDTDR
jgi:peptidoglycan/xylan/chitin deacetylase (PgdA/CDA1 family)